MAQDNSGVDSTNSGPLTVAGAASLLGRLLPDGEEQDGEPQGEGEQPDPEQAEDGEDPSEQEDPEAENSTDEDEDGEEAEKPETHRLKINGEEVEVTLDELKSGYSRQKDYTQKTQAHSATVKDFETAKAKETAGLRAEREQYAAKLGALDAAMKEATPQEPDWAEERKKLKPEEYNSLWVAWSEHKEKIRLVKEAKSEADKAVSNDRRKQAEEYVAGEHSKLIEAIPEWKDPAKQAAEMTKLVKFAIEKLNFTREDLQTVTDARSVLLVRMAYQGAQILAKREAVKAKAEKPETKVEAPKGGEQGKPRPGTKTERAMKRLVKSGSVNDAAAAIATML